MEKDHGKGGLEKGQGTRGGAIRKPSLDMKEEELSQFFDDIVRKKGAKAFDFGVTIPLMLLRHDVLRV